VVFDAFAEAPQLRQAAFPRLSVDSFRLITLPWQNLTSLRVEEGDPILQSALALCSSLQSFSCKEIFPSITLPLAVEEFTHLQSITVTGRDIMIFLDIRLPALLNLHLDLVSDDDLVDLHRVFSSSQSSLLLKLNLRLDISTDYEQGHLELLKVLSMCSALTTLVIEFGESDDILPETLESDGFLGILTGALCPNAEKQLLLPALQTLDLSLHLKCIHDAACLDKQLVHMAESRWSASGGTAQLTTLKITFRQGWATVFDVPVVTNRTCNRLRRLKKHGMDILIVCVEKSDVSFKFIFRSSYSFPY
jgi:hypothetical protein